MPNLLYKTLIKVNNSSLVKLTVQSFKVSSEKYPSALTKWAILIDVISYYILEGKNFTNFPSIFYIKYNIGQKGQVNV